MSHIKKALAGAAIAGLGSLGLIVLPAHAATLGLPLWRSWFVCGNRAVVVTTASGSCGDGWHPMVWRFPLRMFSARCRC
jgi:hypothetical protein